MSGTTKADRGAFPWFTEIPTRWMDNDVYGHVNNVVFYSYFDTAVNGHLIAAGGLDIQESPVFGVVAETRCRFISALRFPDIVEAGLRVTRLGRRSVTYEIGLFRKGEGKPVALGEFVHVYVDRWTRRPVAIPEKIRAVLEPLAVGVG